MSTRKRDPEKIRPPTLPLAFAGSADDPPDARWRRLAGVSLTPLLPTCEVSLPTGRLRLHRILDPLSRHESRFRLEILGASDPPTSFSLRPVTINAWVTPEDPPSLLSLLLDDELLAHPAWLLDEADGPARHRPTLGRLQKALVEASDPPGYLSQGAQCDACRAAAVAQRQQSRQPWGMPQQATPPCPHLPAIRRAMKRALREIGSLGFELLGMLVSHPPALDDGEARPARLVLSEALMRLLLSQWLRGGTPELEAAFRASDAERPTPSRHRATFRQFEGWDDALAPDARAAITFAAQAWGSPLPPPTLVGRPEPRPLPPLVSPREPSPAPRLTAPPERAAIVENIPTPAEAPRPARRPRKPR